MIADYSTQPRVKVALRSENVRLWYEVEKDFVESEYRAVRERQMKELELEDDLLNKAPVRYVLENLSPNDDSELMVSTSNLRAKIYKESYEFVRQQRIQCLLHGAWFVNAVPLGSNTRPSRPWRFMRLVSCILESNYELLLIGYQGHRAQILALCRQRNEVSSTRGHGRPSGEDRTCRNKRDCNRDMFCPSRCAS